MSASAIVVFTDGAAKGNPGPGGWGVVIVTPGGHVTELGGRAVSTTNNKMELTGAIRALEQIEPLDGRIELYTDSTYLIKGITEWIWGWRRRGWQTAEGGEVLNRDLWERLAGLVAGRGPRGIRWHYVRGHSGIPGNERVDQIADTLARERAIELYDGPLGSYPLAVLDVPDDTSVPARTASASRPNGTKSPAYSYLSVVDGKPMRHTTWAECERRVKGRSGAKFKKAKTAAEETEILRNWQLTPDDL